MFALGHILISLHYSIHALEFRESTPYVGLLRNTHRQYKMESVKINQLRFARASIF